MASPLNTFISIVKDVTTTPSNIYVTPSETTAIVLLAQCTNVSSNSIGNVTFYTSPGPNTELVKNFLIPIADAASLLTGKLVIEEGKGIGIYANANGVLKLTLSILETK